MGLCGAHMTLRSNCLTQPDSLSGEGGARESGKVLYIELPQCLIVVTTIYGHIQHTFTS